MKLTNLLAQFLIIFLLIAGSSDLTAQESESKPISLKLYSNFGWYNIHEKAQIHPSPAVSIEQPGGNFHEFELSELTIDNSNSHFSGHLIKEVTVALRYEYNFRFFHKKDGQKLQPFLGLSVSPSFYSFVFDPTVSTQFEMSGRKFSALMSVVPRINYSVSERFFLDLNIPIGIAEVYHGIYGNENPTLESDRRKSSETGFLLLPEYILVRLGVGFRL